MSLKRKSYKITCSLKEGYDADGKLHQVTDAAQIIKHWLSQRIAAQLPIVAGLLQEGTLFFPSVDVSQGPVTASPTIIYTGELSSAEDLKREDSEVKHTLELLARELKAGLCQRSVFIIYQDENWCV